MLSPNTITRQVAGNPSSIPHSHAMASGDQAHNFRSLLDGFLRHMSEYRHYSPLTVAAYSRDCQSFIGFLEQRGRPGNVLDVTRGDVYAFITSLGCLSPASIRRTLYGLSSFFKHLVDMEIIDRNPAAGIDPPKLSRTIPRAPTAEQCGQLLQACESTTEECAISMMLLAGLRRCEVLGLQVGDVAADFSQLLIRGKGRKERMVPVSLALHSTLRHHLEQREADSRWVIVNAVGRQTGVSTFYRMFRRVLKRAGLAASGITPHSLRHAFASFLVRAGVDVATIAELLGHANIATTSVYLHATDGTKMQAVELLDFAPATAQQHFGRPDNDGPGQHAGPVVAESGVCYGPSQATGAAQLRSRVPVAEDAE